MLQAKNPILKGFYPDPSICAVGEDFYLVNSSFCYFPGVPLFHSKDLSNWTQIGNVLSRSSQLPLEGCAHSQGIFAPTIRYHEGTFYMITTNVSAGGNFIVTSSDPAGPWSEPYYLGPNAKGIDPSLFFDTDGKCYYVGTRPNEKGVRYNGDWEIWIQEINLETMSLTGPSPKVWKGAVHHVIWPEGPHLYKKGEYYYLLIAEGGTGPNHSITVARSRSLFGPYENNPNNPIFTHRHLGLNYPITCAGHGDLVETSKGDWYIVMLGSRPHEGYTNLGRETFLAEVTWENDWPVISPGTGILQDTVDVKLESYNTFPSFHSYYFGEDSLPPEFLMLRNPSPNMYKLLPQPTGLRLFLQPTTLKDKSNASYIGIRQQHYYYQVHTQVTCHTTASNEVAGFAIMQNNLYNIRLEVSKFDDGQYICLYTCENGLDTLVSKQKIESKPAQLKIIQQGHAISFYYKTLDTWHLVGPTLSTTLLSTEVSGGFTGCTLGMYASSNGLSSESYADFGWFSYQPL